MRKPDWRVWLENKKECKKRYNFYLKKKILRAQPIKPEDYLRKALHNLDFANWVYENITQKSKIYLVKKVF
jgi:transcription initiation factor TFIIIB Brf1 subunit/transcription initiation factor TFIIB